MASFSRTVIVTGGTSGLGYECALKLAKERPNYQIIIASRSDPNSRAASMNKTLNQNNVKYLPLDLSSFANIRAFAADYSSKDFPQIEALVLNAGLQFVNPPELTSDGIEKTFAVNHTGHVLLFYLMRPYLADNARIVLTSSGTHDPAQKTGLPDAMYISGQETLASLNMENGRQRYATSKLCNVLWTYALDKRIKAAPGKKWTVTAFDPGLMPGTGLARDAGAFLNFIFTKILPSLVPLLRVFLSPNVHTPQDSGAALARLAVGEDVEGLSGVYFEGRKQIDSSVDSHDVGKQEDLYKWTLETVARDAQEMRGFVAL